MTEDDRAHVEVQAQIGRSAGHICFTEFRHETYLTQLLSEAAVAVWSSLRSAWILVEIWNNGTTIWESPERNRTLLVTPEGELQVQESERGGRSTS
jgi:hypothetical protein